MYGRRRPWRRLLDLTVTQTYFRLPLDLPNDYVYPCTTYRRTHTHLYTRCPTARSPPLRSILSALFPPPFLHQTSSSLNPSHPTPFCVLTLSQPQRTEDHTPGDKASSYPLPVSPSNWRKERGKSGGLFVDFRPPSPKQRRGQEEAGKETFLFLSSKENCCEGTVFVKSGHARVEKALGKEDGQGE